MLKCMNCGGTHETTKEMRVCYQVPQEPVLTERQLKYLQDLVVDRVVPDGVVVDSLESLTRRAASDLITTLLAQPLKAKDDLVPLSVPDSRYAFMTTKGVSVFFRVKTNKRTQVRYVERLVGAPGDFRAVPMNRDNIDRCINQIKDDPALYSMLFGILVGQCGVCGSPLTDPNSIALGIGPICASKYEW